jgi:membrane-associated phospholipid phosphatase
MHGGAAYQSFPSGHMAATCAVVSVLWIWYPRLRWLVTIAGIAVGVGLIGANYHFLSDVIAGAFIGISIGLRAPGDCDHLFQLIATRLWTDVTGTVG